MCGLIEKRRRERRKARIFILQLIAIDNGFPSLAQRLIRDLEFEFGWGDFVGFSEVMLDLKVD